MSSNAPAGSLSNTDRERTETLARAYKTKGFQAIDNEDWTAAITAFLHFIPYQDKLTTTSSAECAEGFEGLGTAALGESKYSEAEEAFKEVLRVREDNSHGGLELGDRLDVVHPREKMAKVREHQGRLLDARDLRLRGEKDGRMRCAASKCARNTVPYAELSQVANAFSTALLLARKPTGSGTSVTARSMGPPQRPQLLEVHSSFLSPYRVELCIAEYNASNYDLACAILCYKYRV